MRKEENEGQGTSVILNLGDALQKVPKSHRFLVTPAIREAFPDPVAYFGRIADRCPFPNMKAWLEALTAGGLWDLALHQGTPREYTDAGFRWWPEGVACAEITPPSGEVPTHLPETLRAYYSLVDKVGWMPFGCAGGLDGARDHASIEHFHLPQYDLDVDPSRVHAFGSSTGGDMLIYTDDDRGGWLCHENGRVHLLGTVAETIEWVYAELLADRSPDFDYGWL
ncbi:hypothetical protein [Paludisphaera soli]|uniref:hypothetical protein n=1 Tax=Paludisphaera soli TaxID=2712865 RepID=UPI001F10DACA|nr:hypothetical protein [Paludisphaera soli]